MWYLFCVFAQVIPLFFIYNKLFPVRLLLLEDELPKSHKDQVKIPYMKRLSWKAFLVILLLLSGYFDISPFTMVIFQLDDFPSQTNFPNHHELKQKIPHIHMLIFCKTLVWSCCVASFYCRCPAFLVFLFLHRPIFN